MTTVVKVNGFNSAHNYFLLISRRLKYVQNCPSLFACFVRPRKTCARVFWRNFLPILIVDLNNSVLRCTRILSVLKILCVMVEQVHTHIPHVKWDLHFVAHIYTIHVPLIPHVSVGLASDCFACVLGHMHAC